MFKLLVILYIICGVIISRKVCEVFLFFCRWSFTNNSTVMNNFLKPNYRRKLNICRSIYFKKNFVHRFEGLISTNKLEGRFFEKIFFQGLGAFFMTKKPLIWVSFFPTKSQFCTFFQGWLFT